MIAARMHPEIPRLRSPAADIGSSHRPLPLKLRCGRMSSRPNGGSDKMDREWSEYNHHWAGVIVFAAGLLAFLSRFPGMRWARYWPLSFAGLSDLHPVCAPTPRTGPWGHVLSGPAFLL